MCLCEVVNFSFCCRIITSLPVCTQRLLVLLFGTFRVIASNSQKAGTGMTSEALGVSVAPSFFHSCVSDGKTAKMEDVMKFKVSFSFIVFSNHKWRWSTRWHFTLYIIHWWIFQIFFRRWLRFLLNINCLLYVLYILFFMKILVPLF